MKENMEIYNTKEYKTHPLYPLLADCIKANTGGSFTQNLCAATQIEGWQHNFVCFNEDGTSLERLSWNSSDIKNQLIRIYS